MCFKIDAKVSMNCELVKFRLTILWEFKKMVPRGGNVTISFSFHLRIIEKGLFR